MSRISLNETDLEEDWEKYVRRDLRPLMELIPRDRIDYLNGVANNTVFYMSSKRPVIEEWGRSFPSGMEIHDIKTVPKPWQIQRKVHRDTDLIGVELDAVSLVPGSLHTGLPTSWFFIDLTELNSLVNSSEKMDPDCADRVYTIINDIAFIYHQDICTLEYLVNYLNDLVNYLERNQNVRVKECGTQMLSLNMSIDRTVSPDAIPAYRATIEDINYLISKFKKIGDELLAAICTLATSHHACKYLDEDHDSWRELERTTLSSIPIAYEASDDSQTYPFNQNRENDENALLIKSIEERMKQVQAKLDASNVGDVDYDVNFATLISLQDEFDLIKNRCRNTITNKWSQPRNKKNSNNSKQVSFPKEISGPKGQMGVFGPRENDYSHMSFSTGFPNTKDQMGPGGNNSSQPTEEGPVVNDTAVSSQPTRVDPVVNDAAVSSYQQAKPVSSSMRYSLIDIALDTGLTLDDVLLIVDTNATPNSSTVSESSSSSSVLSVPPEPGSTYTDITTIYTAQPQSFRSSETIRKLVTVDGNINVDKLMELVELIDPHITDITEYPDDLKTVAFTLINRIDANDLRAIFYKAQEINYTIEIYRGLNKNDPSAKKCIDHICEFSNEILEILDKY
jgi:hypothetical protein